MVIIGLALLGGFIGYYTGAFVACAWLWPESNLCGLPGALITGPIGLLAGAILGWRLRRSSRSQHRDET